MKSARVRFRIAEEDKSKVVINFRVTEAQRARLLAEAGDRMTVTALIHARVFAGGVADNSTMRKISALHALGRRIQALTSQPAADRDEIATVLADTRAAIRTLAGLVP